MANEPTPQSDGSFIIRIWWERGDDGLLPPLSTGLRSGARQGRPQDGHWRGWIQHVRNGNHVYFASLPDMTDFIERETGIAAEDDHGPGLV